MSTYAETPSSFYISPRQLTAAFLIAASLSLALARCGSDSDASGPRSPLDTNGTRGSGYTPPGGWDGWYQPKGMAPPGSYTELPDGDTSARAAEGMGQAQAIRLPGDIMGTTTLVISFGEEAIEPTPPPAEELTEA